MTTRGKQLKERRLIRKLNRLAVQAQENIDDIIQSVEEYKEFLETEIERLTNAK